MHAGWLPGYPATAAKLHAAIWQTRRMETLPDKLHFRGPFTFVEHGRGIATSGFAGAAGVYLWTKTDGITRYIHYVGETKNFLKRHKEHLTGMLSAHYGVFRADAVAADDPTPLYGGMWRDKSPDPITNTVHAWLELHERIHANLESIEVFFAPTDCAHDMRKHVEGCLARQLKQRHPGAARFYPADNRTIPRKMLGIRIAVTAEAPIEGLDPEIEV